MKRLVILAVLLSACSTLSPQQQTTLRLTASGLAEAATLAAPFVPNPAISASLYAIAAVSRAYGTSPVPTNIVVATTQDKGIAATVLPLVKNKSNGAQSAALIEAAAALLASGQ